MKVIKAKVELQIFKFTNKTLAQNNNVYRMSNHGVQFRKCDVNISAKENVFNWM